MARKKLTQEELVIAFNQYMPKRPVYPPLVPDDEVLDNSETESEGSDDEEADFSKRWEILMVFTIDMSAESRAAYKNSPCKFPTQYLTDNVQKELVMAIEKLVNLKIKPPNPIEWLGYRLLNMNINDPQPPTEDHKVKPTGAQLDYTVGAVIRPEVPKLHRATVVHHLKTRECCMMGKRKHTH